MEPLTGSPKPAVRRLLPGPPSPVSLEGIRWSSMSCSESPPEYDSHSPSHSLSPASDFFHGDAKDVQLPSPECNMGRPLVYLGSVLGLLCAVGGVATATFVLSGGGRDEEEDLPSAYEMRRYADELMRHSNDFARFRRTPVPPPSTVTSTEVRKAFGFGRSPPIWRDRPATTTISLGTTPLQEATTESSSLFTGWRSSEDALHEMREDTVASRGRASEETEWPLPNFEAVSMPRSAGFEQTRSKAKSRGSGIKVIESGGISSDTTSTSTGGRRRGLLALPLPTKVYGPGPRSLLCLVAGGGVRRGPPLRECSHLVLGDQVLDLQHRVIKPAWRA
ncbi:uncharacterized protein LOC144102172 [Amblyomma americanum]